MIKADIINKDAQDADITKVKAVEAVEAVFEAMKRAMQRGERIVKHDDKSHIIPGKGRSYGERET